MNLLSDLIKINSYKQDYTEITKYLKAYLSIGLGFKVILQEIDEFKSNVIAIKGNPKLILNCHMDTVPPAQNWTTDPLTLTLKEEKFYGLGTCDTKGNMYTFIKAVEESKVNNIMLLFSVDEEKGLKTGVQYFLESEYKNGIERAIVGEPTNLKFVSRHKGYYSFEITSSSTPTHSSIHRKGAIVKSAFEILKLHEEGFNIGMIEGGSAGNVVSQICKYRVSLRTYASNEEVTRNINNLVTESVISPRFVGPALKNEKPEFEGDFIEVDFWSEASLFQAQGINSIVFGAGDIKQAHNADEYVEKVQLLKAKEILIKLIEGL